MKSKKKVFEITILHLENSVIACICAHSTNLKKLSSFPKFVIERTVKNWSWIVGHISWMYLWR